MLGLDTRGSGGTLALPVATRQRLAAWSPTRRALARQPSSLSVSLAQLISGSVGAGQQDVIIPPPQNYAQLERRYGTSAPVFISVRRKGRDLAAAPFRVSKRNADETLTAVKADDPLATLLRKPNPWMSGAELVYFLSMFLDLTGNFFLLILRDRKGVPRQLYPVNPMAVAIYGSQTALVASYELSHYGTPAKLRAYGPASVGDLLHFKLESPIPDGSGSAFPSPWGIGPLEAAWNLVVTEGDAVTWNRNLMKNDGRPSGLLTSDLEVDNTTADEAMDRWRRVYGGPENAGKILVLGKNLKYDQIAISPKDMDYLPATKELWRRIIAVFDLNETILGFTAGDVGRRDEQVQDYWRGTIMSTSQTDVCPGFATLAAEFGEDYVVEQDFSKIRALQPNWVGLGQTIGALIDRGMSWETVNGALELGLDAWPGWDRRHVSAAAVPLDPTTGEIVGGGAIGLPPAPDEAEAVA